jgi:protein-disulfide isomerase
MNRKRRMVVALSMAALSGLIGACATPKPGTPEAFYKEQQEKKEMVKKQVSASVEEAPEWFTQPPEDAIRINAVATNYSSDMQLAIDKAVQDAKAHLADKLQGVMSGKVNKFMAETGAADNVEVTQEFSKVSTSLFTNVSLSGYAVAKQKVISQGNGYRAYVLVNYPVGAANRVLVDQVRQNAILASKLQASKAYAELEKDVDGTKAVRQ